MPLAVSSQLIRGDELLMRGIPLANLLGVVETFGSSARFFGELMGTPAATAPMDQELRMRFLTLCERVASDKTFNEWVPMCATRISGLRTTLSNPACPVWEAFSGLRDFVAWLQVELGTNYYLQLDRLLTLFYTNPLDDWDKALASYPQLKTEIEEASKCLGLERYTAAVFHLMRIMEFGLHVVRQLAGVRKKSVTWDAVLVAIDRKLADQKNPMRKTPRGRKKLKFLAEAAMSMRAAKDAWRNPTMHDYKKVYTRSQAIDAHKAVKVFMNQIAEGY